MNRSIRIRLIVWIMALLLPVSAAGGWLLVEVFAGRLVRDIDVALREEAETVASLLSRSRAQNGMQDLLDRVSAETDLGAGKSIVVMQGDRVVGESPPGARRIVASPDPTLRTASYRIDGAGEPLTVSVAVPAVAALSARQRLTFLLAIGIPLSLLAVLGGLFVVIGRTLRPLEQAAARIESIGADGLAERIAVDNSEDEVGRVLTMLNRMLERLERAVAELQRFTADAAHEIRTPLTVLRTTLEVTLARERSADEYRNALHETLGTTERIQRMAEDLLILTRLEAAAAPPTAAEISLGEMLRELADAWREPAAQREVTLHVEAQDEARITGDAGHLYRLFNNLIDNAVRHSPPGGSIVVRARAEQGGWCVTVNDEGRGIAADEIDRIFDRFHRGSDTGGEGGSGLGLSIAREIARAHGGDIRAENLAAGGLAMSVRLPFSATH